MPGNDIPARSPPPEDAFNVLDLREFMLEEGEYGLKVADPVLALERLLIGPGFRRYFDFNPIGP